MGDFVLRLKYSMWLESGFIYGVAYESQGSSVGFKENIKYR